jgi:CP family cyanate transporter-like MFS transporter
MAERRIKILALLAIALLALNLRIAVSALSPLVTLISVDIPLPLLGIGLLGIIAPLTFAVSGSITAAPTKRWGLEIVLLGTLVMMIIGHLLRGFAWDFYSLAAGSVFCLLAMGVGNVLLPVIVRKYFPTKVGLVSSFYITLTAISATIAPLIGVPLALETSWRVSLGQWALLAALATIPMLALVPRKVTATEIEAAAPHTVKLWKSPTALAIAGVLAMTSTYGYTSFAWLSLMVVEHGGSTVAEAGQLLALFAVMGIIPSLVIPNLAARYPKSHGPIIFFSVGMGLLGSIALLAIPTVALPLWIIIFSHGPVMFPLGLTLFNLRAKTRATVLAVSSFAQTISYSTSAAMVILAGVLRQVTGSWDGYFIMLIVFALIAGMAGVQISKGRLIDDELDAHFEKQKTDPA